jgi:hypothetical protein
MEPTTGAKRASTVRRFGWLGVASMLALALLAPSAGVVSAALTAAVYTSNDDGSVVNANIYEALGDVYLTGGPCPEGGDLPDGDYYFEVVQPAGGGALLSTDPIGNRMFTITDGLITSASGHVQNAMSCEPSALVIQLAPYSPSINGEYKLQVATRDSVEEDCANFDANVVFPICNQAEQKSDNFKVRLVGAPGIAVDKVANPTQLPAAGGSVTYTYAVTNVGDVPLSIVSIIDDKCSSIGLPTGDSDSDNQLDLTETWIYTCTTTITQTTVNTVIVVGTDNLRPPVEAQDQATVTVLPPTAPPITAPPITAPPVTAAPSQAVLAATGAPVVTLPPTDSLGGTAGPSDGTWRLALMAMAALLASVLVLTPAKATNRRR